MSYQLLSSSRPRARKGYDCIWCREKIVKGEQHVHEASRYCGDFQDHRFHTDCFSAAREYFSEDGEAEFDPHAHKRGSLEEA